MLVAAGYAMWPAHAQATNPIPSENALVGNLASEWDVAGSGDPSIQGFATDISVNTGATVSFKINTGAPSFNIDIYRLGYYGGNGARKVATTNTGSVSSLARPVFVTPRPSQPTGATQGCDVDAATGRTDCGSWPVLASWSSAGAVSGIYVAKLSRTDIAASSHIVFVVREDARAADIVVQTSDTTWQAYNRFGIDFGGGSLYCGGPTSNAGSAYASSCGFRSTKVSYNRPFDTRAHDAQSWLFSAEYPMVRFLEANGYNVKYQAGVDTDRFGSSLTGAAKPKIFVSSGHDEYWSAGQRNAVEAARNAGINLAFFSGNEMFWKTRFEAALDGTPYRTLVDYKDTLGGAKIDPMLGVATGTWRDTRFGPPLDGGRPENAVTGTIMTVNSGTTAITVPSSFSGFRFWRNTSVASLAPGAAATLAPGSLGYEWDEDLDNGSRPAGLMRMSSTTFVGAEKLINFGAQTATGDATHSLTLYRHASGALVFGAGTVQWAWGLDASHDDHTQSPPSHTTNLDMQQATVNLFADMSVLPATADTTHIIITGASGDHTAPSSSITGPIGPVNSGSRTTVTGTALDSGGIVAGVEVSTDGGATWHLANGTTSWSYQWQVGAAGSVTIKSRAIDDSGNLETPSAGVGVTVSNLCPCPTLFQASAVPTIASYPDGAPVELGVKFHSDLAGSVTGVRFYRGPANLGTHTGTLWTSTGTLLATATFIETDIAPGWQQVNFSSPVGIAANTTYVVSYHTNVGGYATDAGYFGSSGVDAAPLHADASGVANGNGVFQYGATSFPNQTFNATNYWVDVVFSATADTTPPVISALTATVIDSSNASVSWTTNELANSRVDYGTDSTFATNTQSVSNPAFVTAHTLRLTGLRPSTHYYYRVISADTAGNTATAQPVAGPAPNPMTPPPLPGFDAPAPMVHDTTSADFSAGTLTNTYVSESIDGEVILAPARGAEFSGTTMPPMWSAALWQGGGSAVVANGLLTVSGARVASCVDATNCADGGAQYIFTPGHALDFSAKFTGDAFQHSGFGQTLSVGGEPIALFSTGSGNTLMVRSGTLVTGETQTDLGPSYLNAMHQFRIDWEASFVAYYIDGNLVATHSVAVAGPMRPIAASEFQGLSGKVIVDYVRSSPYQTSGSFLSRVMDGGAVTNWSNLTWIAIGDAISLQVRGGNTPTVDGSWTAFQSPNLNAITLKSRYVQYVATFASSDASQTPVLHDVQISGTVAPASVQPPPLAWNPTALTYGTPLGAAQLNATSSLAGSYAYTPAAGAILNAGSQTLSVTFTPSDPSYSTLTQTAQLTVNKAPLTGLTFTGAPATAAFGSTFSVAANPGSAVISASGGCSVAANVVTMTSGTTACGLSANWPETANYLAGSLAQSTNALKVDPATTTIVSSAAATNYGQLVQLTGSVSSTLTGVAQPTGSMTYNDVLTYNTVTSPSAVIGTAAVSGANAIYSTFALAAGKHSITATYGGDANYNSKSSSLVIVTITPVGIASLNPTSVNFPSQPIGVPSMAIPVTMTNIGDANLAIAGVQVSGDNPTDFQTSGNTCNGVSLIPGASCVINVKFNPNATGTRTASLIFTDNNNGIAASTQPISLVGSSMSNSSANFTPKPIAGGTTLWFASEVTWAKGPHDLMNVFMDMTNHPVRLFVTNGSIKFTANATTYTIPVPDALITFSPLVTSVTTTFDAANNRWLTTVPTVHPITRMKQFEIEIGRIFASGAAFTVPAGGLPGGIKNVTWSAAYTTDTPGMDVRWRWGAAVYSQFGADYNALNVKPTDPSRGPWAKMTNADQAGTPEAYKQYFLVNGGGTADDADDFTGDQTPNVGVVPDVAQASIAPIPVVFPGVQAAGTTTAPVLATITNNHQTLSLIVSSLAVSGIDFTLVSAGPMPCSLTGPTTLAGGGSCTVGVVFTPKDMGTRTGTVNIGFSTPPGIAADEAPKPFKLDIVGVAK